jgi:competence protein ComEC
MSLKQFKQRIAALLLFFIDYQALLYCFTFLVLSISLSNFLEKVIFKGIPVSIGLIVKIFLPAFFLFIFFFVSYDLFCHVHIFATGLKVLLLSTLLFFPIFIFQYLKISKAVQKVQSFTGQNVSVTGVLMSQEKESTYIISPEGGQVGELIIKFDHIPVLHAGQECKITGEVVQPESFEDFDYRKYLFRKGIYAILQVKEYECVNGGNIFLETRYSLERIVEKSVPEPEASLLIGIMFGSKRIFLSEFNTALNNSGVSHVIAASGYNVALVAQGVDLLFKKKAGKSAILIKIGCIWGFSMFSGLSSSLVRAATMSTLSLIANLFGRESNNGATVIFCATLLVLLNPFLIHDVGFLFSFASVIGLIFFPKCFENIKYSFIKDSILPTITCILFTIPISVAFFGKVSVISLLSNIVIVPIIGSSIFWGLGATVINIFIPLEILYLIPYIQLTVFKNLVMLSSSVEMVELQINGGVFAIAVYLLLFLFCLYNYPIDSSNYYNLQSKKI